MKGIATVTIAATAAGLLLVQPVWAGCGQCGKHGQSQDDSGAKASVASHCENRGSGHHGKREHMGRRKDCPDGACKADYGKEKQAAKGQGAHGEGASLNTQTLATLLDSGVPVVVLDARSGKYDDGRRIPGAKAVNAGHSAEEVDQVVSDKDALIVTYCSNLQCPASEQLARHLRKLGYRNVVEYPYGIEGWVEAGHEFEQSDS